MQFTYTHTCKVMINQRGLLIQNFNMAGFNTYNLTQIDKDCAWEPCYIIYAMTYLQPCLIFVNASLYFQYFFLEILIIFCKI